MPSASASRVHEPETFYYSFLLLSREQRDAMCAIYAFMRYCDDISEGEGASREGIERWRRDLDLRAGGPIRRKSALAGFSRYRAALSASRANTSTR